MSQASPSQGTAVADGPPATWRSAAATADGADPRSSSVVLVLGALAYFFVFSGGDDAADAVAAADAVRPGDGARRRPPARGTEAAKAPKLSKKSIGKDPFKALVVASEAAAPRPPQAAPRSSAGTTVTSGGTTVTGGGTTGGTTTGGAGDQRRRPSRPRTPSRSSRSLRTTRPVAVTVGSKSYSVAVGDVFGTYFKVAAAQERQVRHLPVRRRALRPLRGRDRRRCS